MQRDRERAARERYRQNDVAVRVRKALRSNPYWNPRPFGPAQRGEIRQLLDDAYEGVRPA